MSQDNRVLLDVSSVPENITGAGRYIVELTRAFSSIDAKNIILITKKNDNRFRQIAPNLEQFSVVPDKRGLRLGYEKIFLNNVRKKLGCKIIHSPHYLMPISGKKSTVVTIHDLTFIKHPEWHTKVKAAFFSREIKLAFLKAGAIICVSEFTKKELEKLFGDRENIYAIHHGINLDVFNPDENDDDLLIKKIGINSPFVLFVGTIEPRKNLERLISAFNIVKEKGVLSDDTALVLTGKYGWKTDILNTSQNIIVTGFVNDATLAALYRKSLCVVYPALEEGFGLPVLEAMACGAKVVTSENTPMAELASSVAFLSNPFEIESLAAAIENACSADAVETKERSVEIAKAFSWQDSAKEHLMVYDRLLRTN